MIREDYIIRLIKQFADALGRMMRLRSAGDPQGALAAADELYEALGIPRELCALVDTPTLAGMLRHAEKMRAAARLSWEEGHAFTAQGDPLTAFARYRRAHELFLEARAHEPAEGDDEAILELSRLVPAQHLDPRYWGGR
jgi:hypothetical protein